MFPPHLCSTLCPSITKWSNKRKEKWESPNIFLIPSDLYKPRFSQHVGNPALTLSLHHRTEPVLLKIPGLLTDGRKAEGGDRGVQMRTKFISPAVKAKKKKN